MMSEPKTSEHHAVEFYSGVLPEIRRILGGPQVWVQPEEAA